jgi:hypothetical protein
MRVHVEKRQSGIGHGRKINPVAESRKFAGKPFRHSPASTANGRIFIT